MFGVKPFEDALAVCVALDPQLLELAATSTMPFVSKACPVTFVVF